MTAYALHFDKLNDYVSVSGLSLFADTDAAVVGWLYLPYLHGVQAIVSEYASAGDDYVTLGVDGSALTAAMSDGTNTTTLSGGTLTPRHWHHVALVADGSNLLIYLDGIVVDSGARPAQALSLDTTVFGRDKTGNFLCGALADVRGYSAAPTAAQIEADYEHGIPLPAPYSP